ncbi:rhomboid-like protein [Streptomyces gilvosporeus]|uniref:Uncharacterized protein n=1 Tax=Streptomyces gilvosporeus TaxID=553510 RepID=A0A1V0TWV1_9ACTN|nr:rhomboid-like protein [Streptomyces gilvosporeus]ARF57391.1 hypothetical protein B1H19_27295 [Streptomyces gilvosporeus]
MSWVDTADGTSADSTRAGALRPGAAGPGTLSGVPRQRGGSSLPAPAAEAPLVDAPPAEVPTAGRPGPRPVAARRLMARRLRAWQVRPWRLLPTPTGTPFTFGYALLLTATSLFADHADPVLVDQLLRGSSTDIVHLAQAPLLVLCASALWIAGGLTSGFAIAFLFTLTALERRIGALRTAAVFFCGHALATLATELPVGFTVAAGGLPDSSLVRLDYGISFGVMTCLGALAGVLPAWCRWPLLAFAFQQAVTGLIAYTDPMTDWGHLLSLSLGVAAWPALRRWHAARGGPPAQPSQISIPSLWSAAARKNARSSS